MLLPIYNNLPQSQANTYDSNVRLADRRQVSTSSDTWERLQEVRSSWALAAAS